MAMRLAYGMVALGICAACGGGPPTPLTRAAGAGDAREVQALLAQGADPNATDGAGGSALIVAARAGHLDVMRILITDGPRIGSCNVDTVKALLRHAPDLEMPATFGSRAARFVGRSKECREAFALLERRPGSGARGGGPDQREGQRRDRELPARDPQTAREAAQPGDRPQHR